MSSQTVSGNFTGGWLKPHRTDLSNGVPAPPDARLNVLLVFVWFPDDQIQTSEWPIGNPPTFHNKMIAASKSTNGNFWDRYNDQTQVLSDYYQELSGGLLHMTGIVRNYQFDHNRSHYFTAPQQGAATMNAEIYAKLRADQTINWQEFDLWKKISDGNFKYEADGNIDMVMMIRRSNEGHAGEAGLEGSDFEVDPDPDRNIWIRGGFYAEGSGFYQNGNSSSGPLGYDKFVAQTIHEFGHFLWGYHSNTGAMTSRGGLSVNDLYASPLEKYKLGYLSPVTVNYNQSSYSIGDISNRFSNDELLKVPIGTDEYFLIANRRKISKYDIAMLGDTTKLDIRKNTGEYGKGVYIYHYKTPNFELPGNQDIETADGIFNWVTSGTTTPDWSSSQQVTVLQKGAYPNSVNNDAGSWMGLNNTDDVNSYGWFSSGERHSSVGGIGKDGLITNKKEYWTSRRNFGDRWDAWNLGYNEVFSPYSNPNTKDWNNNTSGIFIYYNGLVNGEAQFDIYKVNPLDPNSENDILQLTPPSKPMNVQIEDCGPIINNYYRIRVTWNHNMEPDMVRTGDKDAPVKRYKIYRSTGANMNTVPPDAMQYPENVYQYLTFVDVPANIQPEFVDTELISQCNSLPDAQCPPTCWILYPVRYRIQAVDDHNTPSVLSDFASTEAYKNDPNGGIGTEEGDNPTGIHQELFNIPTEFALKQNYPNPFNPVTNIRYDIPQDVFVTVKVYNALGKEVTVLVNDFKKAGSYIAAFDGSALPSGIYFYKIQAANFTSIKRMVLVK